MNYDISAFEKLLEDLVCEVAEYYSEDYSGKPTKASVEAARSRVVEMYRDVFVSMVSGQHELTRE